MYFQQADAQSTEEEQKVNVSSSLLFFKYSFNRIFVLILSNSEAQCTQDRKHIINSYYLHECVILPVFGDIILVVHCFRSGN